MKNDTISVDPYSTSNFFGAYCERSARSYARQNGAAGALRADGSFRLFYLQDGKLRQKTWKRFTLLRSDPRQPIGGPA